MKFRKTSNRTEKALRHAQKPATPRSANPIGPESTYVVPGEDPPMANPPPRARKMTSERPFQALPDPSRPFPALFETGKSHPKTGLSPAISGGFPTVFSASSTAVFRQFCQWPPGGFPAVLPAVFQRFYRRFPGGFPAVSPTVFSASSTAVRQRFSGNTLPLDQPRSGSGLPLHPKEIVGNSVHTFKPANPA